MRGEVSRRTVFVAALVLFVARIAAGEVVGIDVRRVDDFGAYVRVIGRVRFAIDPNLPANRAIADINLAPTNADGKVEFASDVLFFRPKDPAKTRGSAFIEIVNRGRDQSLLIMSDAVQRSLSPESWNLGDNFLLDQGFAVAFLGWQFDVDASDGLTFTAPAARVDGLVRADHIEVPGNRIVEFGLEYCAASLDPAGAKMTFRPKMDAAPQPVASVDWAFSGNGCAARVRTTAGTGIYELVYRAGISPIAGLGLAAIRDFASYLRYGPQGATLRENPAALQHTIGYGYSQSARVLRDFVRDGFNADERGRQAFDALMISSAGAGGSSVNHRFAMPGIAGNSVLSVLRPVDVPPFTDAPLLARATAAKVAPKIFYTFSSTEYWARAGSLTHTSDDGAMDVPFASSSRLYFIAGTPHASGDLSSIRLRGYRQLVNFAQQRWIQRALLVDLDDWARSGVEPPPSRYPTIAAGQIVPLAKVRFPKIPTIPFPTYMPQVWHLDFGPLFATARVITNEPPTIGAAYPVLVPQVDEDGNDVGGVRIPELAVPLGTFTGWNVTNPQLRDLGYLAGLVGSFDPFPMTAEDRDRAGDPRRAILERYAGRDDYLARVRRAALDLVSQRFARSEDVEAVVKRAGEMWDAITAIASR